MEEKIVQKLSSTDENSIVTKYNFYILIYNIQKYRNIGTMIRSASAFNIKSVFICGNKKILDKFYGNQHTTKRNEFIFFDNLETIKKYCKDNNISICGIEITDKSQPVHTKPFTGHTLFVFGNEGTGLSEKQKQLCDQFVYIEQYSYKTESLNVAVAASIVFHHFALFANYTPAVFSNEKFVIKDNYDFRVKKVIENNTIINDEIKDCNEEIIIESLDILEN